MSFFADLLAGAMSGGATGYIKDQEDDERLREKLELKRQQQEQALALQAQRQQDRVDMFNLSQAAKGGSAGGGGKADEFNPAQAFERAYYEYGPNDPRTQRAYELVGTYTKTGQGSLDSLMGRARAQGGGYGEGAPTSADVVAAEAYTGAPQPPDNATRGQREAMLGEQELRRFRASVVDNGKNVDDFAKAETGFGRTDLATAEVQDMLQKGKPLSAATNRFNEVTNSAKANPLGEEYARIKQAELDLKVAQAGNKVTAGETNAADKKLDALEERKTKTLSDLAKRPDAATKLRLEQRLEQIDQQIKALDAQPVARTAPTTVTQPAQTTPIRSSAPMRNSYPRPSVAAQAGR